uniref:RRM domain-containing protein n=1 Tax=Mycena chlorophos TaxID=658473 RepID=A0ABQ0LBX0_MYCCL|nr:predicted protein [Mycena chlorophos]
MATTATRSPHPSLLHHPPPLLHPLHPRRKRIPSSTASSSATWRPRRATATSAMGVSRGYGFVRFTDETASSGDARALLSVKASADIARDGPAKCCCGGGYRWICAKLDEFAGCYGGCGWCWHDAVARVRADCCLSRHLALFDYTYNARASISVLLSFLLSLPMNPHLLFEQPLRNRIENYFRLHCFALSGTPVISTLGSPQISKDTFERQPAVLSAADITALVTSVWVGSTHGEDARTVASLFAVTMARAKLAGDDLAIQINTLSPRHLHYNFVVLVKVGLTRFHPDLFGDKDSSYNQFLRHIAVITFQKAILHGGPGLALMDLSTNLEFLYGCYDNFIHQQKVLAEQGQATGVVAQFGQLST